MKPFTKPISIEKQLIMNRLFIACTLLFITKTFAQTGVLKGIVLDSNNQPLSNVSVFSDGNGTTTNSNGFYLLKLKANETHTVVFSHLSHKSIQLSLKLSNNEEYEFHPLMDVSIQQIAEVIVDARRSRVVSGVKQLNPESIRNLPGANAGVENLLMTLPGVNSNNELSTQYAVRGGNYDENLVYVNDIEVYRPFLIRSGQQEGLSFLNPNMIQNADFSAGGFQAKYGDKLSSVLDITYKTPVAPKATANMSLLGGDVTFEMTNNKNTLTGVAGVRYRDNSLFVSQKEIKTNYDPRFADAQTFWTYKASSDLTINFFGSLSSNEYNFMPMSRQTNFGTIQDPKALVVYYEGKEEDIYTTAAAALRTVYSLSSNSFLKGSFSVYHAKEQENFDIIAAYGLGTPNNSLGDNQLGEVDFVNTIGAQQTHARNQLNARIMQANLKFSHMKNDHHFQAGVTWKKEAIKDRIVEWEVIDSAGFSIRPPDHDPKRDQPYTPYTGPLVPYQYILQKNNTTINRISAYAQWSYQQEVNEHQWFYNLGVRAQNWELDGHQQQIFSPRAQVSWKPNWDKDMLFRMAIGNYAQPPVYKELRNFKGLVSPDVKAQQSWHFLIGHDYSFLWNNRPFKLQSELYYKSLFDVNPYTLENVRIRYAAQNNTKAYATGLDLRLNGEFVPGTESWISVGLLKTEENIENQGYIARPTDQRLKMAFMFQDYVPRLPKLKLLINMVYNTGLPGGSPSYANPYDYQLRLRDYFRADLGIFYVIKDNKNSKEKSFLGIKHFNCGFEIFNLFDVQNSITNTWVRDVFSKNQYAIPNYMTPRIFNLKFSAAF